MRDGIPGRLTYRVVDPNSGEEVVNPLPHPHRSSWSVMALQPSLAGSATVGEFKLPLASPGSDEYEAARRLLRRLDRGLKLEAFLGDVASGAPRFTGVIQDVSRSLKGSFQVSGKDTLWWLYASQLLPAEDLPGTFTADQLLARLCSTQELMLADDFSGGATDLTANYFATDLGASTDPNFGGLPCARWTSGMWELINRTSMTAAQYQLSRADAIGSIVPTSSGSGEISVVVQADSTGRSNCIYGRAYLRNTASGVWSLDAEIHTVVGGTSTLVAQKQDLATGLVAPVRLQVTLVGTTAGGIGSGQVWRLFINGMDPQLWYATAAGGGYTGVRAGGSAGGTVYLDLLCQSYRNLASPRFGAGSVTPGSVTPGQMIAGSGQRLLDLWAQALSLDGYQVRKNCGMGARGDTYDLGPAVGQNLSGVVRFEEGVNLVDLELGSATEAYASDLRLTSLPGGDSGGSIVWPHVGSVGDMALIDTVTDVSVPGFTQLALVAQRLQALKQDPWLAKTAVVRRDASTVDRWRELDWVMLHCPRLEIEEVMALVLGYTFAEGSAEQTVYLDQYSEAQDHVLVRRLGRAVEMIGNTLR